MHLFQIFYLNFSLQVGWYKINIIGLFHSEKKSNILYFFHNPLIAKKNVLLLQNTDTQSCEEKYAVEYTIPMERPPQSHWTHSSLSVAFANEWPIARAFRRMKLPLRHCLYSSLTVKMWQNLSALQVSLMCGVLFFLPLFH